MIKKKAKKQLKKKNKPIPLVVETHPKDYKGYPFITLLQHRKAHILAIVDNMDSDTIKAYVLDLCGPESLDEQLLIDVAATWYKNSRTKYPISVEFSKLGLTPQVSKIYKSFNVEFITRVIGPVPKFPIDAVKNIRRRRRKSVSPDIRVIYSNSLVPSGRE